MSDEPKEPRLLLTETKDGRRLLLVNLDTSYTCEYPVVHTSVHPYGGNFYAMKGEPVDLGGGRMELEVGIIGDFFDLRGIVKTKRSTYDRLSGYHPSHFALNVGGEVGLGSPLLIAVKIRDTWFAISGNEFPDPADVHSE